VNAARVKCARHRRLAPLPAWVVCVHVVDQSEAPAVASRLEGGEPAGHVLCRGCLERAKSGEALIVGPLSDLRAACEQCVLERWRLDGAS